jgi:hypothetical protein
MTRYCGGLRSGILPARRQVLGKVRREANVFTSVYSWLRLVTLLALLSLTAVAVSVLLVSLVNA